MGTVKRKWTESMCLTAEEEERMPMGEHAPRPWRTSRFSGPFLGPQIRICNSEGRDLLDMLQGPDIDALANARLIVRAVNAHADLLAACKTLLLTAESMARLIRMEPHGELLPLWSQDIATAKAAIVTAEEAPE